MSTDTVITLDLIRHGEPEGGVMYRGSRDDALSGTGWTQMRLALQCARDDGQAWDAIVSSPMKRCRAFAEWAAGELALPLGIIDNLREMHFGDLEGLRPEDAWAQHGELLRRLWASPETETPPNGERFPDFVARVQLAIDELAAREGSQRLLVVAHGGVIRACLRNLLHMNGTDTFRIDVPYAGMTRLRLHKRDGKPPQASLAFINGYRGS